MLKKKKKVTQSFHFNLGIYQLRKKNVILKIFIETHLFFCCRDITSLTYQLKHFLEGNVSTESVSHMSNIKLFIQVQQAQNYFQCNSRKMKN